MGNHPEALMSKLDTKDLTKYQESQNFEMIKQYVNGNADAVLG